MNLRLTLDLERLKLRLILRSNRRTKRYSLLVSPMNKLKKKKKTKECSIRNEYRLRFNRESTKLEDAPECTTNVDRITEKHKPNEDE